MYADLQEMDPVVFTPLNCMHVQLLELFTVLSPYTPVVPFVFVCSNNCWAILWKILGMGERGDRSRGRLRIV